MKLSSSRSSCKVGLGGASLLLGSLLLAASVYRLYVEEQHLVDVSRSSRALALQAKPADCGEPDPALTGHLVYLRGCPLKRSAETPKQLPRVLRLGGYVICTEPTAAQTLGKSKAVPETCSAAGSAADGQDQVLSVVAVQAKVGEDTFLVPLDWHGGTAVVVKYGTRDVDTMMDELMDKLGDTTPPLSIPRGILIALTFVGCFGAIMGLANVPGSIVPSLCRVPAFQSCGVTLMSSIAVMLSAFIIFLTLGIAWCRYSVSYAVPLFVCSVTCFCLLLFIRFRCAYDGYDEDEILPIKEHEHQNFT